MYCLGQLSHLFNGISICIWIFLCSTTTDHPDLNIYVSNLSQITQENSDELDICHKTEKSCFKNLLELLGDNIIITYYSIIYKIQTHKTTEIKN